MSGFDVSIPNANNVPGSWKYFDAGRIQEIEFLNSVNAPPFRKRQVGMNPTINQNGIERHIRARPHSALIDGCLIGVVNFCVCDASESINVAVDFNHQQNIK